MYFSIRLQLSCPPSKARVACISEFPQRLAAPRVVMLQSTISPWSGINHGLPPTCSHSHFSNQDQPTRLTQCWHWRECIPCRPCLSPTSDCAGSVCTKMSICSDSRLWCKFQPSRWTTLDPLRNSLISWRAQWQKFSSGINSWSDGNSSFPLKSDAQLHTTQPRIKTLE